MTAVRPSRLLAMVLAGLLAVTGILLGVVSPASATGAFIDGYVTDGADPIQGVTVISVDSISGEGTDTTDVNGYYSIPLTNGDDTYSVAAGSDEWVWEDQLVGYVTGTTLTTDFALEPGDLITGTVTDAATTGALPGIDVLAIPVAGAYPPASNFPTAPAIPIPGYFDYFGPTDILSGGTYRITVPLGDTYEVVAFDPAFQYDPQAYNGINASTLSCACADEVDVPSASIDFDMYRYEDWVYFSVYAEREPNLDPFVHLFVTVERKVLGVWMPAASGFTDPDGYVDLFALGAGEYRISFSEGGSALSALTAEDSFGPFPLPDPFHLEVGLFNPVCGCGGSFVGEDYYVTFGAAPPGGGGTPAKPRKSRTSSFAGFTLPTPTPTPTPSATPTSSPSPSSSPSESPSASPEPTVAPEPTSNPFDLWWLWLLLAAILALIIFFLVRLIRGRP